MSISPTSSNPLYDRLAGSVHIMGILNVTPDSFSDGGRFFDSRAAIDRARQMIDEGADLLDIGGESTRPGSDPVSVEEELRRVIPVIEKIRSTSAIPISIDTTKSRIAEAALAAGASIVNDISSTAFDPDMIPTVVRHRAILIIMHMQGIPKTMQQDPRYTDVVTEVHGWLKEKQIQLRAQGIRHLVVDPGFGFGKRPEDNWRLLAKLDAFRTLNCPVLVGTSRKSFLGGPFHAPPNDRLEGTLISNILAVKKGATLLRVHDVRQVRRAVTILDTFERHASD